jgi:hypothetical protein
LRQAGFAATSRHHADKVSGDGKEGSLAITLICYASPPSDAMRRYTLRKLAQRGSAGQARHLVIDYHAAAAPAPSTPGAGRTCRHFRGRHRGTLQVRGPTRRGRSRPRTTDEGLGQY